VKSFTQTLEEEFLLFMEGSRIDGLVKSHQGRRHSKKLRMQGARILRNEAYLKVRCNDEG